tara:strand:- start:1498 stop:2265 length:768 start_codon:yes stop_codon:yes gene_type:complete
MSTVKVEEIQHPSNSNNAVSVASDSSVALKHSGNQKLVTSSTGVDITGTCTATTFSGSGASLTSIPAGNLTGALPAIDGSNLTGVGGGGALEFVSKSTISTNNSTTQINLTGLDYGSLYKVVMKLASMSGSGQPHIHLYLDGSINTSSIIDYVSNNAGYQQQLFEDQTHITLYTAGYDDNYWEYEILFMTGYYGWFRTMQHPIGHSYPAGWGQCWGHLNPSNLATKRISGLSLRHSSSRTFQTDTEVLLYKFKES